MGSTTCEASGRPQASDRRLIMQVVDYWESVRGERPFPLIADFDIDAIDAVPAHSFLIAIDRLNVEASRFRYVGETLKEDGQPDLVNARVNSVPRGTLMSRLTDHYLQVLANRCPMGFEAEYNHKPGVVTQYRGVMLPFSDRGPDVDYVLGTINSRRKPVDMSPSVHVAPAFEPALPAFEYTMPADDSIDIPAIPLSRPRPQAAAARVTPMRVQDPVKEAQVVRLSDEAALFQTLCECRAGAYILQDAEDRAVKATHAALRDAFAFALEGRRKAEAFAGLLESRGIEAEGMPFLAALRLVFGRNYDPARLRRFADMLAEADRKEQTPNSLITYLEGREHPIAVAVEGEAIPLGSLKALRRL